MISLYVIQGSDLGHRFELCETKSTIGRDPNNHIYLRDSEVSRLHAHIEFSDGRFHLFDDGSINGVFVNGKEIKDHVLKNGDQILLGQTLLLFANRPPAETTGTPPHQDNVSVSSMQTEPEERKEQDIAPSVSSFDEDEFSQSPFSLFSGKGQNRPDAHLKMMYHTALVTSQTLDIGVLLHRILDLIFEWVEIDRGSIMLFDQESCQLIPQATRLTRYSNENDEQESARLPINKSIIGYVLKRREGVLTNDAQTDSRWDIREQEVREIICVPMMGRYGLIGIIYLDTFQKEKNNSAQKNFWREIPESEEKTTTALNVPHLTSEHLRLMLAIAHQAALAVEDTRYYKGMIQGERLAAVGQTVMTLSHHIKNILQGISGGSHLIQLGLDKHNEELIRKGWDIVERNQTRISHLILDMLTFSKEREPAYEFRDIHEILTEIIDLMRPGAEELNIEIVLKQEKTIPKFYFDAEQIHRAITNIITNGIEAVYSLYDIPEDQGDDGLKWNDIFDSSKQKGMIRISVDLDEENSIVLIDTDDNGPGIAKSQRASLFKPFYSEKKGRGTGLGLSVAEKVVGEHNGTLQIEDSDLGGARFKITLPFKQTLDTPSS